MGSLAKLERLIGSAAAEGADLAVFPEAFIPAYLNGFDFGAVVGRQTEAAGRDHFRRYLESTIEVPGPDVERIAGLLVRFISWSAIPRAIAEGGDFEVIAAGSGDRFRAHLHK